MTSRYDRRRTQRDAGRERESLDRRIMDWWAYLQLGGLGLILVALILYLALGIDMHRLLSGVMIAALGVGAFWLLRRTRRPK